MTHYLISFLGGCLIGLAAVLMMLLLGRISGISGILWSAIRLNWRNRTESSTASWPWLFVIGLPAGALLAKYVWGVTPVNGPSTNLLLTVLAGLLVGIGTKLGSGCTSGHGVCGISRVSARSLVATVVFMSAGILTVFLFNTIGGAL